MAHFHNNALIGASGQGGYQIERSLRFNSADSAYLSKTPTTPTNNLKWTFSCWVKRSALGANSALFDAYLNGVNFSTFYFTSTNELQFYNILGGVDTGVTTTGVYRDLSAWYHIVFVFDSANATAADRAIIYVNGTRPAQTNPYGAVTSSEGTYLNNSYAHSIGRMVDNGTYLNGYLTETYLIDGQALTPSSFGETDTITGVWKPKKYTGTYGTNGFYLKFADNSGTTSTTLGKDSSGNGNNWTPNNFSVTAGAGNDSMIDTPTPYADGGNGRGNYCTGNPLYIPSSNSRMSLTNGNLEWGQAATNANSSMTGTFLMRSGKWYWEVTIGSFGGYSTIGMQTDANTAWRGSGTVLYRSDGQKVIGGTNSAYGASFTTNDVLGFAYDADAGTLTCYKNNTSQGTIYSSGTGNSWVPAIHDDNAGVGVTYYHQLNFGQRSFSYTPPAGFLALNTQNLPEPSIKKPSSYMDVVTWTGNATYPRAITGLNFSPDLLWIKSRSNAYDNVLMDAVRGTGNTKWLSSNLTDAEGTNSNNANVSSLDSAGFTIGTTGGTNILNASGVTNVAWCWDESATPGFDIVTYTGDGVAGRTVAHSLGVVPKMVIVKRRNSTGDWPVWHEQVAITGSDRVLFLNTTDAQTSAGTNFNSQGGTSSVFYVGTNPATNASGGTYVAYLWSEVAGFSKFGSYTGNGSSDGPFVHLGFRPRWVILKRTDSLGAWDIHDAARDPDNVVDQLLEAQNSNAEASYSAYSLDFVSNGFKLRGNGASQNASSGTFIYAAFAETPFRYSLAR